MSKRKKTVDPDELMTQKEYGKAIAAYQERLRNQPGNASYKLSLAEAFAANNQVDEALKQYKELGEFFTEHLLLVKAIAVYKKMLLIRPEMKGVEKLLAEISEKREDSKGWMKAASPPDSESMLFKDLSSEEFQQLVKTFALRHFDEDTVIVKEGDPGDSLFIIVHGQVRVITTDAKKREIVLANLGDGDFFGEVALLTGKPRTATIMTNIITEVLELSTEDYQRLISQYPHIQKVVEAFHKARAYKTVEAIIQASRDSVQ